MSFTSSQDVNMPQNDLDHAYDLPSLELHRNPTHANPKPHDTPAHDKSTESTLQIQGWVEIQAPDGTSVLQELPVYQPETRIPRTGDRREGYWLRKTSAQRKAVPISNYGVVATKRGHPAWKYRRCRGQLPQTPKRQSKKPQTSKKQGKRSKPRKEEAERHRAEELADAETEWTRCGYPSIGWGSLNSRLQKFSAALLAFVNGTSRSFYRTELESAAIAREEQSKYLGMGNATAGYYGPRGQQILMQYIITEFGSELRLKAGKDRLMHINGVGGYVVSVLVPELAVMLIQEDMKVSKDSARQILRESTRLGETLHEDLCSL